MSVHWEVGNAFAAMLKRRRVTLPQIRRALAAYADIPVRFLDVDLTDAMAIADECEIYAYDAYVLTCARHRHAPVLSLDRGLLRAAAKLAVDTVEV